MCACVVCTHVELGRSLMGEKLALCVRGRNFQAGGSKCKGPVVETAGLWEGQGGCLGGVVGDTVRGVGRTGSKESWSTLFLPTGL